MGNDWKIGKDRQVMPSGEMEKAVIVGLISGEEDEETTQEHLDELEFLALTAGAETLEQFTQKLPHPDKRYFIGSGKADEIREFIDAHEVDMVIFDDDLSPSQNQNLEKKFKIKVLDRSLLILDIFANHAQTAQARAQVELAQMQYLLPRLRGL